MSQWRQIRPLFLDDYPAVRRRWQSSHAQLRENGMEPIDAEDGADEMVGIGINDPRVDKWLKRTGWTPETPAAEPPSGESGEGATDVRNVRWVAENLTNPKAEAKNAPSLTSWNMMIWARASATNTGKFWSELYKPIMLPAKKDLETTGRQIEDEERLLGIVQQVKNMAIKDES